MINRHFDKINIHGIGTDIVECSRIELHGEQFLNLVYSYHEIGYCDSRKTATQHFAGR